MDQLHFSDLILWPLIHEAKNKSSLDCFCCPNFIACFTWQTKATIWQCPRSDIQTLTACIVLTGWNLTSIESWNRKNLALPYSAETAILKWQTVCTTLKTQNYITDIMTRLPADTLHYMYFKSLTALFYQHYNALLTHNYTTDILYILCFAVTKWHYSFYWHKVSYVLYSLTVLLYW